MANRAQDEPRLSSNDKFNQSSSKLLLNLTNVSSVEKIVKDKNVISGEQNVRESSDNEDSIKQLPQK